MRSDEDVLRTCPTCRAPNTGQLGLRDFRWVDAALPGRVGGSDIDYFLEQSKTGRMLALELKPPGASLPMGQRLLLKALVRKGIEVWVVWEHGDHVEVGAMNRDGQLPFVEAMDLEKLAGLVSAWWSAGLEEV